MKITTRRLKDIGFELAQTNGNDAWFHLKLTRQCHLSIQRIGSDFSTFHPKNGWISINTMKDLMNIIYHEGHKSGYRKHQNETNEAYDKIMDGLDFLRG